MATKNKIKITFDPIIFIIFAVITGSVFLINHFIPSLELPKIFTSPTSVKGSFPFSFKDPLSWCRIFLYIFGTGNLFSWLFLACMKLLLPEQETNFGTGLIAVMILLSIIFSGVLFACFSKTTFSGCEPVIFLLIILDFMASFKKKTLNISSLLAAVFFCVAFFISYSSVKEGLISFFISLAGGLCGSLVSFITNKKSSPKKKTTKKTKKEEAQTVVYFDNEADSPRFKNKNNSSSEDETVVGTLNF